MPLLIVDINKPLKTEQGRQHSVYTQTSAFSESLFYLINQINYYKQTTKSTVCVNYDMQQVARQLLQDSLTYMDINVAACPKEAEPATRTNM